MKTGNFSELLARGTVIYDPLTSPRVAFPGNVIPANRKWYRDLVCVATIVEALERLDMRFPPAEEGVEGVVIE